MYQTNFLLKLTPTGVGRTITSDGGVKAKVKLARQIQGAKFLEIFCDFSYISSAMAVKCSLIDDNSHFSNIVSVDSDDILERVTQTTTMLLIKNDRTKKMIPINQSKSVVNEFDIEIFILRDKSLTNDDKKESFIQVTIHHTA